MTLTSGLFLLLPFYFIIILQDNLQQLSNFILEKKKGFDFVIPKMKLNRNDSVELRERILNNNNKRKNRFVYS